jgi:hypothetical protein
MSTEKLNRIHRKKILKYAPPSLAVVAFVGAVGAICYSQLPSSTNYESIATLETLTGSNLIDKKPLAIIRLIFALIVFLTQLIVFVGPGWEENVNYPEGSKLKPCKIWMKGPTTLVFFTVWSWLMLGVYFLSASSLFFLSDESSDFRRMVLVCWEVAAPNALLVSVVITFVIWPEMIKKKEPTDGLAKPTVLMQHNLNSVMVLLELFLGNTPLTLSHAAVAPIFGLCYVIFAWAIASYISPKNGAVYLYFFFDSTLGAKFGLIAHAGLLTCLAVFFVLAVGLDEGLNLATSHNVPILAQGIVLFCCAFGICKFRD